MYSDVMKDYFTRARRGDWGSDPAIAAKTPDDIIRFTSFLFATTKQLDKVRSAVRWKRTVMKCTKSGCMHRNIYIVRIGPYIFVW